MDYMVYAGFCFDLSGNSLEEGDLIWHFTQDVKKDFLMGEHGSGFLVENVDDFYDRAVVVSF